MTVAEKLDELEHLIDGGVWPPSAVARVGWTLGAAGIAARRARHRIAPILTAHVTIARRGERTAA